MTDSPVSRRTSKNAIPRLGWAAGMRGEWLTLGPVLNEYRRRLPNGLQPTVYNACEHGMASWQTLDWLGIVPGEQSEICHPADEPAVRLNVLIERIEWFCRRGRLQRLVFAGCGPLAAAAAVVAQSRRMKALWLRPSDPSGLVERLGWENYLLRLIEMSEPAVTTLPAGPVALGPKAFGAPAPGGAGSIPGRRPDAPLVLTACFRRSWGAYAGDHSMSQWLGWMMNSARRRPDADWAVLSLLYGRLDQPLRESSNVPSSLLVTPPLPYPEYWAALNQARAVVTDSPGVAAEAMALGIPVAAVGEAPSQTSPTPGLIHLTPGELAGECAARWIDDAISATPPTLPALSGPEWSVLAETVMAWQRNEA